MWPDNDIDKAFQRLNPPEPEPASFPLDAWLRLETRLDQAVIERAVRQKLWRFFAAEVAVVALVALGWLLWPTSPLAPAKPLAAAPKLTTTPSAVTTASATKPQNKTAATALNRAPTATVKAPAAIDAPATPVATGAATISGAGTGAGRPTLPLLAATRALQRLAGAAPDTRRKQFQHKQQPADKLPVSNKVSMSAVTPTTRNVPRRTNGEPAYAGRNPADLTSASVSNANTAPRQASTDERDPTPNGVVLQAASAGASVPADAPAEAAAPDLLALAVQPVALAPVAAPDLPAALAVADAPARPLPAGAALPPRFFVGLVAAPDVSTVKFVGMQAPLPNVGVTLEYRLGNRLRLSTGLLRSTKQYAARRDDYDWRNYPRAYYRDFTHVDATCTVLDVPLNLRYDLAVGARFRVFGSAGLSTFFMQRERYTYDYVENGQPEIWDRSVVNQNRHLFGIFNLSAGYERSLGKRWSVQAEPYLKLPLAGVGQGRVNLVSGGVFMGVKHGF
ncbi:hypothetical protein [Hymenobacter sp.]|uniref:hypothetical protein n=1 Tax=Hymenobacter sp. TaxID=1898978 RepID=UPI00286C6E94|nr:hypothetical protein [Hymenobacter sp.]